MCGVAGFLGVPYELASPAAARVLAALHHRGPDDNGRVVVADPGNRGAPAVLVHARLAILDVSPAGHQPMSDRPQRPGLRPNWIVLNGEIFNFRNMHQDLARAGWPCRSQCDTEVILHGYRAWGEACVDKFRGMFAWCLLDAENQSAWFCRDRLGIKALYLARPACGGLIFASEVRALLAAGHELVPQKINPRSLESFLAQGAVCGLESIVEGVELLAPGQSLRTDWSGRTLKSRTYWQMSFPDRTRSKNLANHHDKRARAVGGLADTLREAVKLHLVSDVPLGLFLSGGIDSTAIATVATELTGNKLQTIHIGFDDPQFDETEDAAAVARSLRTNHQSVRLSGEAILENMARALAAVDQPTVDGFNTYFVSEVTRRAGLKVALSGLGGDELFGGYATFRDVPRALRWSKRLGWLKAFNKAFRTASWMGGRGGAKAAEMMARPASALHLYLLRRELFLPSDRRGLHPLPAGTDALCGLPVETLSEIREQTHALETSNRVSSFEVSLYMRHMLLRDADVFSMAHGLELRVPLLDHKVVEEVTALPGAWKGAVPRPKGMLIEAVGKRMPRHVLSRPKRGFTFPWDKWLRGPLRKMAGRAVQNSDLWETIGVSPSGPTGLWQRFMRNDRRVAGLQILALIVLEKFASAHELRRAS